MQKRYTTYKASVESFPLGQQNIGLIKPGRFNGFDIFATEGGLNISLNHSGQIRKTLTNNTAENAFGALVMPTGIIIHDTNEVALTVGTNVGNVNLRTDLVICEHNYQEIEGGTVATYSIIQGAGDGTVPVLTNPTKQIIIGKIEVAPEGSTFGDMTYIIEPAPLPGDMDPSQLYDYISQLIIQAVSDNGGEANTAGNSGTGAGIFKNKTGVTINLKTLKSPDGSILFDTAADEDEVHLKVGVGSGDRIDMADSFTLLAEHNGKMIRILNSTTAVNVTVPEGLPVNYHVGIFQDKETEPPAIGVSSFGITIKNITFVTSGNAKLRSAGGRNKLLGPGYSCLLHSTGITDYHVLMGDLAL